MKFIKNILLISGLFVGGNVLAGELTAQQKLGMKLYQDVNLSLKRNQSCESCHTLARLKVPEETPSGVVRMKKQPAPSFVDPASVQQGAAVSNGSVARMFGSLNAPSAAYAAFSPAFHWDGELFIGGQFWNGRASDLVAQAKGPFLNPAEMAMPSEWSVVERLKEDKRYQQLFKSVYQIDLKSIQQGEAAVEIAYQAIAEAIAAFEMSPMFRRFDSKFDFEAVGMTRYTLSEQRGADLFDGAAMCGECHVTDGIDGEGTPALLTDFSYDNLGVPANPLIPGNPSADPGLLGNPNLEAVRGEPSAIDEVEGRHKVMSLRNIALTPPYMHNGGFQTLEEVVHFYNTRDVLARCENPADATNPGFGITCWPEGEFHHSRNVDELGNLGLTEQDEMDIVAYLKTFTDNYPQWGNSNGLSDPAVPEGTPSPFEGYSVSH